MNDIPITRYAKSGDINIAYQVVGDGPFDIVFVPNRDGAGTAEGRSEVTARKTARSAF